MTGHTVTTGSCSLTHLHIRPVQLLDVKVVYVQMQRLLAQLAGGDRLQVGACSETTGWHAERLDRVRADALWGSPEWILEQSHLLMQSWWTNCRLPVQWQGWRSGLEAESSPIWQILHRSPSSSSDSSSSSLKGATHAVVTATDGGNCCRRDGWKKEN